MKEQLAISAAIIGGSVVVALIIAGGPSGIFPQDEPGSLTISTDSPFSGELDQARLPSATEPAVAATTVADSVPELSTTTVPEETVPRRTTTIPEETVPERTTPVPDTTEPDTTEPDTTEPDTTEPDTTGPDTTGPDTTEPDTTEPATSVPVTSAAVDELIAREDLVVAVANAAGVAGIAAAKAEQLGSLGYTAPAPVNAVQFPYTLVVFPLGMDDEASRLALDAGLPATSTLALAVSPDIGVPDTYDLVLVLGTDQSPTG